ncbi:MAG: DUF928 domain-containing protein [Gammaproteobacteria bacterium]|nr:DUF928 domain-containing protein [Gammaproteobacteria bacterium]
MKSIKTAFFSACTGLVFTLATSSPVLAENIAKDDMPVYHPPNMGTPGRRVGGGSRRGLNPTTQQPVLSVLAPKETGQTISAQPTLYWWTSSATDKPVKFSIIHANPDPLNPETLKSLLEITLKAPAAGIQAVRLADHRITLETGVEYNWFVSIVVGSEEGSQDIVSSGGIKRIEPSAALSAQFYDKAGTRELPGIYARKGLWYDAIAALSARIAADPGDKSLRAEWISLLGQVGLSEVAAFGNKKGK